MMSLFSFLVRRKNASHLPRTKGTLSQNVPLAKKTWMGVGGNAEYFFEPVDDKDLSNFIKN